MFQRSQFPRCHTFNSWEETTMDRREALIGTGLIAIAGTATTAIAQQTPSEHHHHGGAHKSLASAAGACVTDGQACLNHCLELLGSGHKELAACARSVTQLVSICGALQDLANQDSKYLIKVASVAMDACHDCEEECKKHADKHDVCKRCGESCAACYKECKQLTG
jgi:Cys-rich four helix bundle protein (predicted Tat secretion target)